MSMAAGDAAQSPDFYVALLSSPAVLRRVASAQYAVPVESDTIVGSLVEQFGIDDDPAPALDAAIRKLRSKLVLDSDSRTGIVWLAVTTESPDLSREITAQFIDVVNALNLSRLTKQADAERQFLKRRLTEAEIALRTAEDDLQAFLQRNRSYRGSPELEFTFDRLEREVMSRQQVHTTLLQALEQAQLDAVRNTPVISVVETPVQPLVPDSRGLLLKLIVGIILGAVVAVMTGLGRDAVGMLVTEREQ